LIRFLVPFGLLVWSTGLAPNPLIQSISDITKDEKSGRLITPLTWIIHMSSYRIPNSLITDDHLNVIQTDGTPDPNVWAIGDAAKIKIAPLPATAQGLFRPITASELDPNIYTSLVANQKAKYLVKKLNKLVKDQLSPKPFEFHNQGTLAYIGNWYAQIGFR
jgi:NADH dehydrogenase FAD-containing subunit